MQAETFLRALAVELPDRLPADMAGAHPGPWTAFMERYLHRAAAQMGLTCICLSEEHRQAGTRAERLFDMNWFVSQDADALPEVVLEHENSYSFRDFMRDFVKLLAAYAPLRGDGRIQSVSVAPCGVDRLA